MVLRPEDTKLFFDNWLGLLSYVNNKHKIVENFGQPKKPIETKPETVLKIKEKLWQDVSIIDEYIDSVWDLPKENIQILKGWKKGMPGKYLIIKHLQKHSVFLQETKGILYGVYGITDPIAKMIHSSHLPIMVETVLMPFKEVIIYDSIFRTYNVSLGSNFRKHFNSMYAEIKKKKGVITSL